MFISFVMHLGGLIVDNHLPQARPLLGIANGSFHPTSMRWHAATAQLKPARRAHRTLKIPPSASRQSLGRAEGDDAAQ